MYDGGIIFLMNLKIHIARMNKGNIISGTYELFSDKKLINIFKNNKLFLKRIIYINYDTRQILTEFYKINKKRRR